VEAVRSAGGKKNGALSDYHAADLGAAIVDACVEKTGIDPNMVEDVIIGCVSQVGQQAGNIGRNIVLSSKVLPETCPGTAVDRQCGSSQQALHFAAQAVMSGVMDCVIAGGVESMSNVPIGANIMDGLAAGHGLPNGKNIAKKYESALAKLPGGMFSQFEGAELLAQKYGVTRAEMDSFGAASHAKAVAANAANRFAREIVPLPGRDKKNDKDITHSLDEGIRPSTTIESLGKLPALKKDGGVVTAGTASQICDGASAIMVMNEEGLKKSGLKPLAKIITLALAGDDPVIMLGGPIPASETALAKAGLKIGDIDLYEVNEAFAPVPLAWAKALGADLNKLNVNGGAMALGHPLGGTGTKLMGTLVHELERRKGKYGLLAICEGGGTANATIIERIPQTAAAKL
jgi:acetyl-CoA C-acetyltransferase